MSTAAVPAAVLAPAPTPTHVLDETARTAELPLDTRVREVGARDLFHLLVARARAIGIDRLGFEERSYAEARSDFERHVSGVAGEARDLVAALHRRVITAASYRDLVDAVAAYWHGHDLESALRSGSVAVLTPHHYLTDVVLPAAALWEFRRRFDAHAADRNVLILSRLMATRTFDPHGNGALVPVVPSLLGPVSRVLHTIQALPHGARQETRMLRRAWNHVTGRAWATLAAQPGNVLHLAPGGGPAVETASPAGRQLLLRSANHQIGRLLRPAGDLEDPPRPITVIGLFMSCPFKPEPGPSDARFGFLPPRKLSAPSDIHDVMHEVAAVGTSLLAREFPAGVRYVSNHAQFAALTGEAVNVEAR